MESLNEFDDTDNDMISGMTSASDSVSGDGDNATDGKAIATRFIERPLVPNHLLMVSLLEHVCAQQVKDKTMRRELFKLICDNLAKLNVMSPLTYMDEFSHLREQYKNSFTVMVNAAMKTLENRKTFGISFMEPKNFTGLFNQREITKSPAMPPHDIFTVKSTRYEAEFIEIGTLGKGGFGSVYRVRHKLDGCEYAVKKIRFRSSNPDVCFKIINEVKVLARLSHDNIVRYHNAWVEDTLPMKTVAHPPKLERRAIEYNVNGTIAAEECGEESIIFDQAASGLQFEESPKIIELKSRTSMEVGVDSDESLSVVTSAENSVAAAAGAREFGDSLSVGTSMNLIVDCEKMSLNADGGAYADGRMNADAGMNAEPMAHIPLKRKGSDKTKDDCKKQHSETIEESRRMRRRSGEEATGFGDPPYTSKRDLQRSLSVNGNREKSKSTSPRKPSSPVKDECRKCTRVSQRSWRSISYDPDVCDMCDEQYMKMERNWQKKFAFVGKIHLFIQMELCKQTLHDWMETRNSDAAHLSGDERYRVICEESNMRILSQLLEGLAYIHQQHIIHRDIKPRNIFVDSRTQVKIGDFGLARHDLWTASMTEVDDDARCGHTGQVGTSLYAAPEQLKGAVYDSKSDLYSVGVVLYEMFQPYKTGMERIESLKNLRKKIICPVATRKWSKQMCCVKDLIAVDARDRPAMEQLLQHEMFSTPSSFEAGVAHQGVRNSNTEMDHKQSSLEEKDLIIQQQMELISSQDALLEAKDTLIAEKDNIIKDSELLLEEKDNEIARLRLQLLALQAADK